jgi:hypothetical protein
MPLRIQALMAFAPIALAGIRLVGCQTLAPTITE